MGENVFVKQNLSVSAPGSLGRIQDHLIELKAVHSSWKALGGVRGPSLVGRLSAARTAAANWLVCNCQGKLELLHFACSGVWGMECIGEKQNM